MHTFLAIEAGRRLCQASDPPRPPGSPPVPPRDPDQPPPIKDPPPPIPVPRPTPEPPPIQVRAGASSLGNWSRLSKVK